MFVCASTECFPELSLDGVMQRLVDLEYTAVEVSINEAGNQLKPSEVLAVVSYDIDFLVAVARRAERLHRLGGLDDRGVGGQGLLYVARVHVHAAGDEMRRLVVRKEELRSWSRG